MIGSKQLNYLLVKQIIIFKLKTKKNYKTSQFQIKWPKKSYKKHC